MTLAAPARRAAQGGLAMKQLSIFTLALALFSLQPTASAQVSTPFMTVDAVGVGVSTLFVTGVIEGQATPSTRQISFLSTYDATARAAAIDACHRQLLLALGRPGQYKARADTNTCLVAP
jgi:high-affinity Fe2+/Pb2+ permease